MTLVHLSGQFPEAVYVWFGDAPGTVLAQTPDFLWVLTPPVADAGTVDVSLRRTGEGTVITMPAAYTFVPLGTELPDAGGPPRDSGGSPPPDPGVTQPDPGGPVDPGDPGDPNAGDVGDPQPDPADDSRGRPNRQKRVVASPKPVELSGGLRGARVVQHDPTAGAPSCTTNPCRLD
jgi:hypothetical protein